MFLQEWNNTVQARSLLFLLQRKNRWDGFLPGVKTLRTLTAWRTLSRICPPPSSSKNWFSIMYFVLLFLLYVCFGFEISFTSSSPSCPYQRPYFLCRVRVGVPCGAFTWANRSANSTPVHLGPSNTCSGPWEPGVKVYGEEVCVRKRSDIFRLTAVPCFHGCSADQWEESNPPTPASVGARPALSEHLCWFALPFAGQTFGYMTLR